MHFIFLFISRIRAGVCGSGRLGFRWFSLPLLVLAAWSLAVLPAGAGDFYLGASHQEEIDDKSEGEVWLIEFGWIDDKFLFSGALGFRNGAYEITNGYDYDPEDRKEVVNHEAPEGTDVTPLCQEVGQERGCDTGTSVLRLGGGYQVFATERAFRAFATLDFVAVSQSYSEIVRDDDNGWQYLQSDSDSDWDDDFGPGPAAGDALVTAGLSPGLLLMFSPFGESREKNAVGFIAKASYYPELGPAFMVGLHF